MRHGRLLVSARTLATVCPVPRLTLMPEQVEREIEERGGAMRWRTLKLPGGRYMHVAVTRDEGPRGGQTVATDEPQEPKDE